MIVFSGEGCDLRHVFTAIFDADGVNWGGPSCRVGTYTKLPKDGAYKLVINSDECGECPDEEINKPGPYHFVFQGGKLAK